MYSLNPLPCNTLITPDEVTRMFNRVDIDGNLWKSAIQIAEERFVRPLIGSAFYDSLSAAKNTVVTSGNITQLQAFFDAEWGVGKIVLKEGDVVNSIDLITITAQNKLLWNNYLWKFIYEVVYFTALPENYAAFTSNGIIKSNPSPTFLDTTAGGTTSGIGLSDLKYLKDDVLLQRISVMQDALERFLCQNAASYPLYPVKHNTWDDHGRKVNSRKNSFVDIYSDDCDQDDHKQSYSSGSVTPAPSYRACSMQLQIKDTVNPANTYTLCNLQTIALEYLPGNTLTVPHLIGKTITYPVYIGNNPISVMPFDIITGTLDNTANGGFSSDPFTNTITINYNEVV